MGFFDRLKNAWNIFKLSFSLLGRDKSLIVIPLILLVSSVLFFGVLISVYITGIFVSTISFYVILLFAMFFMYFWTTFLSAAQSWMVYEVVQDKNTTVSSGFSRASKNFLDILAFAAASLAIALFSSWLRNKGKLGEIGSSFVNSLAGIVGNLVIPSMIVTERNFGDAVRQLSSSLRAVPEIATYEIGIRPLKTIAVLLGVLSSFFAFVFLLFLFGPLGFIFAVFYLVFWILAYNVITSYVETTYYTLVYLSLIEKKKIKGLTLSV